MDLMDLWVVDDILGKVNLPDLEGSQLAGTVEGLSCG